MSVMVQIFQEVKDVIFMFNKAKPSWMEHFTFTEWNICSILRMRTCSLFVLYNLYKDSNFQTNLEEKGNENRLLTQANIMQATHPTPASHLMHILCLRYLSYVEFRMHPFLLALFLE